MAADDGQTPAAGASPAIAEVAEVAEDTTQPAERVEESASPAESVSGEGESAGNEGDNPGDGESGEDDEHDNEDTEPLSVAELESEIAKLRRQSARRRIERNKARDELTTLKARVGELEQATLRQAQDAATAATQAAEPNPAQEANDALRHAQDAAAAAELRALRSVVAGDLGVPLSVIKAAESVARAVDESALREALATLQGAIGAAAGRQAQSANPTPPEQPSQPPSLREQIKQAEQEGTVKQQLALKTQQLVARNS
jgi:hypothetical protein